MTNQEAEKFFSRFRDSMIGGINSCALAKITEFDAKSMKASIQVFPDMDFLVSVPVATIRSGSFLIRAPYKPGDLVVVVFCQRDIDPVMHGEGSPTSRVLDLNDAVIVAGITPFYSPLPVGNEGDFVISKTDFSAKIVMTESGSVEITAPGGISIRSPGGVTIQGQSESESW